MRRYLCLLPLFAVACAPMQPGEGVDNSFATAWGCEYSQVMVRAEELKGDLDSGHYFIPQVGWDACELMARNGKPDEIDRQSSQYGMSATWWYPIKDLEGYTTDMKMVTLELQDSGDWIVTYTGT